jgi:hypothetical protein
MTNIRIILYQKPLGIEIPNHDLSAMKAYKPHFVCFPEYFFVDQALGNHGQTPENQIKQINRIRDLSSEIGTVVIGGTMPEVIDGKMYNTTFVFQEGKELGFYRKIHLFFAEVGKITPGDTYKTFSAYGITFGVLICADIFHDESFTFMRDHGAKIIFTPTFSLKKKETPEDKFKRDNDIYVRGARLADAVIVKVCGVPSAYKPFLQARSLIADKNRVIYRVQPDEEAAGIVIMREIGIA